MTSANETRGEITITLEGVDYVMRPSYEAIVAFEASTGRSLIQLAQDASAGALSTTYLAEIIAECIRAWGRAVGDNAVANINAKRVARLLIDEGVLIALKRVEVLLFMAATGGMTSSGEVKAAPRSSTETPGVAKQE